MVQMHREAVYRRTRALRRSLMSFLQFVVLSAAIPLLFVARYMIKNHRRSYSESNTIPTAQATWWNSWSSSSSAQAPLSTSVFDFLKDLDLTLPTQKGSDVVELSHCDLTAMDWDNFTGWALPILNETMVALRPRIEMGASDIQEEFVLQLLEQYATDEQLCDYGLYRPTVYGHGQEGSVLKQLRESVSEGTGREEDEDTRIRLAIVIVAFHDVEQLSNLVDAVHLPQHYIVIHLERRSPPEFLEAVREMASSYSNVVIVQFGTITYRTDSVSMVNLRIIRWLTLDLELSYDYLLTLDGSAFPLVSAQELIQSLQDSEENVWLGELTQKGEVVAEEPADHLLRHKRLFVTRGELPKLTHRIPLSTSRTVVSETIKASMTRKSTSGNQGIYSHHVIHQLLASDTVMELFALSKYGCCCCLEERNWIAALTLIGLQDQSLLQTSMFQLWGGEEDCKGSMSNAVLSRNASLCYRIEDPGRKDLTTMYIMGDEVWEQLLDAKERGFLFARKFSSDSDESERLMTAIQADVWES